MNQMSVMQIYFDLNMIDIVQDIASASILITAIPPLQLLLTSQMITDKPSDLPIALAKIGGVKPPTPPTSARPCVLFVLNMLH